MRTREGKIRLFVAIDRTSKFAYVEMHQKAGKMIAAQFLRNLIVAVPYTIHTVLTDNGVQFTNRKQDTSAFEHIFDRACRENEIDHRLTKVSHPWTNGHPSRQIWLCQFACRAVVERMNRTIKEATVKRYHYETHSQLETHITDFIAAYNYATQIEDAARPHAIRIHLQNLDIRAGTIQSRPYTPHAGTKHVAQAAIEAFYEAILLRFSGVDVMPINVVITGPF